MQVRYTEAKNISKRGLWLQFGGHLYMNFIVRKMLKTYLSEGGFILKKEQSVDAGEM